MTCLSMPHSSHAMNWVAGHLGVRLLATPPPLLRPNGGGQPWPCACAQGTTIHYEHPSSVVAHQRACQQRRPSSNKQQLRDLD